MSLVILILKSIFEGIWRRWFGGGAAGYFKQKGLNEDSTWYTKLLCSRGTQSFVNYIFLSICFYYSFNISNTVLCWLPNTWQDEIIHYSWILAIFNGFMFQSLYWSKGHGPIFDYGHGLDPSSECLARYNGMWHTAFLDKLWDKWFPNKPKYTYLYDSLSMFIRYTYPCIIVSLTAGWYILPLGLCCSCCYAAMWGIYDHDKWFFEKTSPWISSPTQAAEILIGLMVGFII